MGAQGVDPKTSVKQVGLSPFILGVSLCEAGRNLDTLFCGNPESRGKGGSGVLTHFH